MEKTELEGKNPVAGANQIAYSRGEETANIITHLIGALLAAAGGIFALRRVILSGAQPLAVTSVALYVFSLITMYVMSTLYHSMPVGYRRRAVFRRFDHCSIALVIAGTYAPYMLIGLVRMGGSAEVWGIVIASVVLAMAVLVVVFNAINVARFRVFCMIAYVIMGWSCVIRIDLLLQMPGHTLMFMLLGGAVYTVGILFYRIKRIPWNHAIWHLFVIGGSVLQYISIYCYLLG